MSLPAQKGTRWGKAHGWTKNPSKFIQNDSNLWAFRHKKIQDGAKVLAEPRILASTIQYITTLQSMSHEEGVIMSQTVCCSQSKKIEQADKLIEFRINVKTIHGKYYSV